MARAPLTSDTALRRAGTYELLLDVGRGGMGSIQLARARGEDAGAAGFERLVAIKRAHAFVLDDEAQTARFLDEARLAARVHHANVVGIHRVGRDEAGPYLVFDYVEGDTLDALVDYTSLRRRPLAPPIVLRIVADALAGLDAAHETRDAAGRPLGILHRDVAPQNLLVGVDGVTRLADFGIAREGAGALDADRAYLEGRIPFLTPEYLTREPVDRRVDVYAMGVTAWFALVGKLPWPDATEEELVRLVVRDGVPAMSTAGLEIAPPIERIVAKACARDASERYPTARAMLDDIEALARETGWLASHREVADVVRELAGGELASRRAQLAALVSGDDASTSERSAAREPASGARASSSAARPPWREIVVGAIALLVIGAATSMLAARGRAAPVSRVAPAVEAAPAPAPPVVETVAVVVVAPPQPTSSAAAPVEPSARSAQPRPAPRASSPRASSPRGDGLQIATANPYR
ncbi:MAG TPA: serine/threonine-protein kinase [Byssovorax sp.]